MRKEGDSNPRTALGGYTLSRRASSATRAPFLIVGGAKVRLLSWIRMEFDKKFHFFTLSILKMALGWFYKLPPHIVIKCLWNTFCYLFASFYIKQAAPQQFKQVWLHSACTVFSSKCKFVQSCSSLHSFTLLHFDLKNRLKI